MNIKSLQQVRNGGALVNDLKDNQATFKLEKRMLMVFAETVKGLQNYWYLPKYLIFATTEVLEIISTL